MTRMVEEWKGKTDDAKAPARVRLRIFKREKGRCHISGRKIGPADRWDLDHKIALCNGGENRESNLFPALADKHREKTKRDVAERAETDAMQRKYIGIHKHKGRPMPGSRDSAWKRPMNGPPTRRDGR